MDSSPAVGDGLGNENSTDPHTPDKLLSLLSITSMYICNIEASDDTDAILKDSLKSDFKTINDLLAGAITGGVTIDKAGELQLSDSPIRSAESLRINAWIVFYLICYACKITQCVGEFPFHTFVLHCKYS